MVNESSVPERVEPLTLASKEAESAAIPQSSVSAQDSSSTSGFEHILSTGSFSTPRRPQPTFPMLMFDESLRNNQCFGREEETAYLDQILLPDQNQLESNMHLARDPGRRIALLGLPGVGKTELAAAYASSRATKFDATFWVHADTTKKIENDFVEIARKLTPGDPEESDPVAARDHAKGWLSNPKKVVNADSDLLVQTDASWSLILDNADDPSLLADYWPSLLTGSVLVTSRRPPDLYKKEIDMRPMHIKELQPLEPQVGAQLIRNWTGCHDKYHIERSSQISKILGGLPLALLQCADMVRQESAFSLSDFLDWHQLQAERMDLVELFEKRAEEFSPRGTTATTWAMQSLSSRARALLDVFTFLDPDKIQEKMLRGSSTLQKDLLLEDFPRTFKEHFDTRTEIINRAFVKADLGQKQEFRVHRSVQEIFQFFMSEERLRKTFKCTVALLSNHWDKEYNSRSHSVARWSKYDELYNHLARIETILTDHHRAVVLEPNLQLAKLLFQCAWVQKEQSNFDSGLRFLELAENICRDHETTEESETILADVWHTFGSIANETNEPDRCLHYTQKVVEIKVKTSRLTGVRDRNLAVAYNQHAIGLLMVGKLSEAEHETREALAIMESVVGEDKELLSGYSLNLAYSLWLQGRLIECQSVLEEGLGVRETKFGIDDKVSYRTGAYLTALGNVHLAREDFQNAERLHRRAEAQYETTLGKWHHRTADLHHIMARYKIRQQHWVEAEILLSSALQIWGKSAKFYKPEIARSSFVMANVLKELGRDQEADAMLNEAAALGAKVSTVLAIDKSQLTEADFDALVMYWSR